MTSENSNTYKLTDDDYFNSMIRLLNLFFNYGISVRLNHRKHYERQKQKEIDNLWIDMGGFD